MVVDALDHSKMLQAGGQSGLPESIARYRHALSLEPSRLDLRCNLAALLADAGRHAEALEQADLALQIDAECFNALFNGAISLLALGCARAAQERLCRCARLRPTTRACTTIWVSHWRRAGISKGPSTLTIGRWRYTRITRAPSTTAGSRSSRDFPPASDRGLRPGTATAVRIPGGVGQSRQRTAHLGPD